MSGFLRRGWQGPVAACAALAAGMLVAAGLRASVPAGQAAMRPSATWSAALALQALKGPARAATAHQWRAGRRR